MHTDPPFVREYRLEPCGKCNRVNFALSVAPTLVAGARSSPCVSPVYGWIPAVLAVDSSGFSTSRIVRWFDQKYGTIRQEHDWVKVHLMCGVRTNIVTAVEIRDRYAADTKSLPHLVDRTAEHFKLREVSADKAYSSHADHDFIERHGATIPKN